MKSSIVLALCAAAALAAPAPPGYSSDGKDAVVVSQQLDNIGVDSFQYGYETSNGISAQEQGQLKNVGSENEALEVRGQFSYPGPDGVLYTVTYVANEGGFQPQGAHIPQPPQ